MTYLDSYAIESVVWYSVVRHQSVQRVASYGRYVLSVANAFTLFGVLRAPRLLRLRNDFHKYIIGFYVAKIETLTGTTW